MKIRSKLGIGFLAVVVPLIISFYMVMLYSQSKSFNVTLEERVNYTSKIFNELEDGDSMILSAALEVIAQSPTFKKIFLEKDREKLYNYGQPLFQSLKKQFGITHFYFILPDGHNFVRLHNKELYGDLIDRITLEKAKDTKAIATGIELGKTAFALRAVMPFYDNDKLVGYVELGQEIDHFLETLKNITDGDEYAILVDKKYLDREKWSISRAITGLRDNWDDTKDHVIVSRTTEEAAEKEAAATCFASENNAHRVEKGEVILHKLKVKNRTFACAGIPLKDAGDRAVGAIFSLIDMTTHLAVARNANKTVLSIAIILFVVALGVSLFLSLSFSRPISKLRDAVVEITKGNLSSKVETTSSGEIGELADAFNEMTFKLGNAQEKLVRSEKLAAVGQLASSIGHELRNPLGVIGNSAYFLNMKLKDADEKILKHIDILQREVNRSNAIITDLLDFSRASKPTTEVVELKLVIEDALVGVELPENVTLETRLDENLPPVLIDPGQIRQVFQNLIYNALQAMPDEGRLEITTAVTNDFVETKIKDTGEGISEENIKKIFEPLFTTKAKGIGLGLAIVKGIIDMHKGLIEVTSEAGKGTTFTVKLPLSSRKENA
ncbi:MAG: HAMP domain-containing protein [Deltaproteobacteria bacterium]|nr:HAMP domain-containing protein [Deltaproteobacteria bacterium]